MGQLLAVAKCTSQPRDMWLVLLGGLLPDLTLERLRTLTAGEAVKLLVATGRTEIKSMVKALQKRRASELLFPSRKGNGPIGRIQVWRIIAAALKKALGVGSWGIKALRRLVRAPVSRPKAKPRSEAAPPTRRIRTLSGWYDAQRARAGPD